MFTKIQPLKKGRRTDRDFPSRPVRLPFFSGWIFVDIDLVQKISIFD